MSANKLVQSIGKNKLKVNQYGPSSTCVDASFNVQPDGSSAMWFEIDDVDGSDLVVEFDGLFLKSYRNGNLVTAIVPDDLLQVPRAVNIRIIDEVSQHRSVDLDFRIEGDVKNVITSPVCTTNRQSPKPNFFMLGAPRSGTTSMYWKLRSHPYIHMSRIKEPYYFDDRAYGVIDGAISDKPAYQDLFKFAPYQARVLGEASTIYLSSPAALAKIREYNPEAKALVMLRNPLTACTSLYLQHCNGGKYENAKSIELAWKECGPHADRPFISNYKELFRIGEQLKSAVETFGSQNLKVILYDDLVENSAYVYADLLGYLGLFVDNHDALPISNSAQWSDIRSVASDQLISEMSDYFGPQIKTASEIIGRDLGHWLAV